MPHLSTFLLLLVLLHVLIPISSSTIINIPNLCSTFPDISSLPSDRLTVLISSFHPSRSVLLPNLTLLYTSLPFVISVILLLPSLPPPPVLPSHPKLRLLALPSPSLNLRFLPLPSPPLLSRLVLVSDDDVLPSPPSLSLALSLSRRHPLSLLGFFPRYHSLSLPSKSWSYAFHPRRHSILLTKLAVLPADYLRNYTCWDRLAAARAVVDRERNCEDILMNFVAAMASGEGPVVVGGRVRDFGDLRNRGGGDEAGRVGLNARKEHLERRGGCITEFHRLLGVMPLKYSYGKVVGEVGEQGICSKDGKLVFCDQD